MRMDSWTPSIVALMEDASRYTGYFKNLSALALQGLPSGSFCIDAGCGMGQLAYEMALRGMKVQALDRSPKALAYARNLASQIPQRSMQVTKGNFYATGLLHKNCDRAVFSLSASPVQAFDIAVQAQAKSIVVINKIQSSLYGREQAFVEARPLVRSLEDAAGQLDGLGLGCDVKEATFEFGQPFRTLSDAATYFELFRTRSYPHGISNSELLRVLEATQDSEFPYYLPVQRHLAVFNMQLSGSMPTSLHRHTSQILLGCTRQTEARGSRKAG